MTASHRRHNISDEAWALLAPHLPGRTGVWGGVAKDNRLFYQRGFLDHPNERAMARSATGLWGLEQHPPPVYPLARQGRVGKTASVWRYAPFIVMGNNFHSFLSDEMIP